MDIEIIRGGKKQNYTPKPTFSDLQKQFKQIEQDKSSAGPGLLTKAGFSALKGIEAPINLLNTGLGYIGEPPLTKNPLSSQLQSKLGYSDEQLAPSNIVESYAQRLAGVAPYAALGGAPALARSALAAAPGAIAESAGLGGLGGDIAQLGTEIGLGVYSGKIPTLRGSQKKQYELAKSFGGKGEASPAKPLLEAINTIEKDLLPTEVDKKVVKNVQYAIDKILDSFTGSKINPNKAMDLRKKIYKLNDSLKGKSAEYLNPLTRGINDSFALYSAENPKFFNHLKAADKLTEAINMNSYINDFVGKFLPRGAIGQAVKGPAEFILTGATGTEKLLRRMIGNPIARGHYFDVVKSTLKGPKAFVSSLEALNSSLEKDPEFKSLITKEEKKYPTVEIIRGGKKSNPA